MQDAREEFRKTKYSTVTGIQGLYDSLLDCAQNMAIYPDSYTILKEFLKGMPPSMRSKCFLDYGMSPETSTLEEFVAVAKEIEQSEKTEAYYKRQYGRTTTSDRNAVNTPKATQNARKYGMNKTPRRVDWAEPNEGNKVEVKVPVRNRYTRPAQGRGGYKADKSKPKPKATANDTCFNCGGKGHFSKDCPEPKKKEFIRAAHSTMSAGGSEGHSDAEQSENDNQQTEDEREDEGSQVSEAGTHEIDVPASDFYDEVEDHHDFMMGLQIFPMSNTPIEDSQDGYLGDDEEDEATPYRGIQL
jgi:hypothetical protein